jgi:hypothetical protein
MKSDKSPYNFLLQLPTNPQEQLQQAFEVRRLPHLHQQLRGLPRVLRHELLQVLVEDQCLLRPRHSLQAMKQASKEASGNNTICNNMDTSRF